MALFLYLFFPFPFLGDYAYTFHAHPILTLGDLPSNYANLIGNEDMISVVEDAAGNDCPISNPKGASVFDVLLSPVGIFIYGAGPKIIAKWKECYERQRAESAALRHFAEPMGLDDQDEFYSMNADTYCYEGKYIDPFVTNKKNTKTNDADANKEELSDDKGDPAAATGLETEKEQKEDKEEPRRTEQVAETGKCLTTVKEKEKEEEEKEEEEEETRTTKSPTHDKEEKRSNENNDGPEEEWLPANKRKRRKRRPSTWRRTTRSTKKRSSKGPSRAKTRTKANAAPAPKSSRSLAPTGTMTTTENYYFEQYIGTKEAHNKDSIWSDIKRRFGLVGYGAWGVTGDTIEELAGMVQPPGQRAWGNSLRQRAWYTSKEFLQLDVLAWDPLLAHYLLYLQGLGFYVKFFRWGPLDSPISFHWPPTPDTLESLLGGERRRENVGQEFLSNVYNNGYRRFVEVRLDIAVNKDGPLMFVDGPKEIPKLCNIQKKNLIISFNRRKKFTNHLPEDEREDDEKERCPLNPCDNHGIINYYTLNSLKMIPLKRLYESKSNKGKESDKRKDTEPENKREKCTRKSKASSPEIHGKENEKQKEVVDDEDDSRVDNQGSNEKDNERAKNSDDDNSWNGYRGNEEEEDGNEDSVIEVIASGNIENDVPPSLACAERVVEPNEPNENKECVQPMLLPWTEGNHKL